MASTTRNDRTEGVEFYYESDGTVTAKDIETGLVRSDTSTRKRVKFDSSTSPSTP